MGNYEELTELAHSYDCSVSFKHFHKNSHPFATLAIVRPDQWPQVFGGLAICSPRDNFSYNRGRHIAMQRALKTMHICSDGRKYECITWAKHNGKTVPTGWNFDGTRVGEVIYKLKKALGC